MIAWQTMVSSHSNALCQFVVNLADSRNSSNKYWFNKTVIAWRQQEHEQDY